jgi:peptidoglycan/xylan/chitin deacetylase (PgdA/CDA1 family)
MSKNKLHPKKTKLFLSVIITLLILLCAVFVLAVFNQESVEIKPKGDPTVYVEYGSDYQEPGVSAKVHNSTLFFLYHKLDASSSGSVNVKKLGTYTITYTASYKDMTGTCQRNVVVRDTTPPEIELTANPDSYTPYNHPYTEEGYKATDLYDGDLTATVKSEEKDGTVTYTVSDTHGNTAIKTRTIVYDDRTGPVITLTGGDEITIYIGDAYQDTYTAVDDCDGDVTANVTVTGSVDTSAEGTYTLAYSVTDSHSNRSTAKRTVNVRKPPVNTVTDEGSKTIYLTFDDGPGPYTAKLLDVLDKYNVKATFFTTSAHPQFADMIGQEAARGHTVAVHTYSHHYDSIYASTSAYWADFNAQNMIISQETGSPSNMFRFPGGSSNTISKNYCSGIMTTLANQAAAKGLSYFDWNVSSGDAGGTTDSATVLANVQQQVSANSAAGYPSVVLQHDVKEFSVNAEESIIRWGLENGYSFRALSAGSFPAHHHIAN